MRSLLSILLLSVSFLASAQFSQEVKINSTTTGTNYTATSPYAAIQTIIPKSELRWNKPFITDNDGLVYLFAFNSGLWEGFHDALIYHYRTVERNLSASNWFRFNENFWRDSISWKNKYKDFDNGDTRAKYFGSKTFLVWTTDGAHLTKFMANTSMLVGVAVSFGDIKSYPKKERWKVIAKKFVLASVSKSIGFHAVYNIIFDDGR